MAFVQRFDSGLRLNLHFHVLWLDGVHAWEPGRAPVFAEHAELTDGGVAKLVRVVRDRVRRCLRRLGKWVDEADAADGGDASDGGELVELADGRIGYVLKKRWRDGTTHVVMTKQVLMERLCALVPRAAKAGDGDGCGPAGRAFAGEAGGGSEFEELAGIDGAAVRELLRRRVRVPHAPGERRRGRRRRYSWAELLARVFSINVWLECRVAAGRGGGVERCEGREDRVAVRPGWSGTLLLFPTPSSSSTTIFAEGKNLCAMLHSVRQRATATGSR